MYFHFSGSFDADTEDINENYGRWAGNAVFKCRLCLAKQMFCVM